MQRAIICTLLFASAIAQCGSGQASCAGQCYGTSTYSCSIDPITNKEALCPINQQSCNGACYSPTQYHCDGGLKYGPATATPTKSPTSSTTSTPATSASSSVNCPSWLTACGDACYKTGQYCCTNNRLTVGPCGSDYCPSGFTQCGLSCYLPSTYCCQNNTLTYGACATKSTTKSPTSSTTKSTTSTTSTTSTPTTAPVIVSPIPAPTNAFPTQTADLRIINNCKSTLWFEGRYGGSGAPIPGMSATSLMALPGSYVDYTVPDTGLSGTRFWAKYGCDSNGKNCEIGDQMQYWPNPPGGCPTGGCTPPIDSLFEATWGCRPGAACHATNPTTWFDTSQVDGWTIPYSLTTVGDTSGCDCVGTKCGFDGVKASTLDLAKCPTNEDLSWGGKYPTATVNGKTISLSSVDLRVKDNSNRVIGCISPCKKLTYTLGLSESSGSALWMCCPTPNPSNCQESQGCLLPDQCRAGPIVDTQFVQAVHDMAPGVYAYSYDDGVGLHACPAGVTKYTMEFCPAGSSTYPLQL